MIDIKTISLCIVLINIFLCAALFVAWRVQKVYAGFGYWVLANLAMALGYIIMALTRDIIPHVINNFLFILAAWLRLWGLYLFFGEKRRWHAHFMGICLAFVILLYFSDDIAIRTAVITCVLGFYLFIMAWVLVSRAQSEVRVLYRIAAAIFFIYGLLLMSRTIIALIAPSQVIIPQATAANVLFFLLLMLLDIGVIFTFLMMNDKRLAMELEAAEETLNASLREKEILLKEIHHRVKNNLQVIASLLNLQAGHMDDPKALDALTESRNRIQTMADIHSMLYQSKDLSNIDFEEFIRRLTHGLLHSYQADPEKIAVDIQAEGILFSIVTAMPCSLIINEIVSNTLKHAFPEGRAGEIRIAMTSSGNAITLIIRDNGIGIPEYIDFKNTDTLGLQLVNALVDQLQGSIELSRREGTEFRIVFTAGKHRKENA